MAVSEEIQKQVLAEATSATPNFETDYTDERFGKVDTEYQNDMNELTQDYNDLMGSTDKYYGDIKTELQNQADKQAQIQQEQTDFAIDKIEQQKEQAHKDYLKEQSGAYVDWQKQSNPYGVGAEKMASAGLTGTGYSESSQVSMYNTYQLRVATAKESLDRAKLNYDNNIKEAMLQNNAAIAEIYSNLAVRQAELALEAFQYNNDLMRELIAAKRELKQDKWQKELAIMQQQNTEKAMAWDATKYYDTQKFTADQNQLDRDANKLLQDERLTHDAEQARLNREHDSSEAELDRQHDEDMAELNHLDYEYEQKKKNAVVITGSSGGDTVSKTGSGAAKGTTGSNKVTVPKTTGKQKALPVFSNHQQAIDYLRKNYDIPNASAIRTFGEWSRLKNSGSSSGIIQASKSYGEYLQLHAEYLIDQYAR